MIQSSFSTRSAKVVRAISARLQSCAGVGMLVGVLGTCQEPAPAPPAPPPSGQSSAASSAAAARPVAPSASLAPVAAQALPQQQTPTTSKYMLTHYADSLRMRQGVVAGKLADVQAAAAAVANDPWTPRLRGDYQPYVKQVRDAAGVAQRAPSLTAAAAALGTLGEACAACHLKFGGPGSPVAPVQLGEGADPFMVAHALATDRLWEGLIVPSDSSWLEGARVLVDAPALDSDVQEVAGAARHLRELAQQSRSAEGAQRGKLYSSVLLTCAACHERLGINVAAAPAR